MVAQKPPTMRLTNRTSKYIVKPYCTVPYLARIKVAMKELTPRARAKREQILQAARTLFLERGFSGTSTDALAAMAGVSKETLYIYFPSKEALLAAVLEHLIADFSRQRLPVPMRAPGI